MELLAAIKTFRENIEPQSQSERRLIVMYWLFEMEKVRDLLLWLGRFARMVHIEELLNGGPAFSEP